MGGNSDLERRIMRLEQAIPHVRQRIIKLGDLNGQLIQALSGGGVRAYNDGAPIINTPCGSGPSSLSCSYNPGGGSTTFNYDSSIDRYIGAINFTDGGGFSVYNSCGGAQGGTTYVVVRIDPATLQLDTVTYESCLQLFTIELIANSLPADLTNPNFGANQTTNVTGVTNSHTCGPLTATITFHFGTSGNFITQAVTLNLS